VGIVVGTDGVEPSACPCTAILLASTACSGAGRLQAAVTHTRHAQSKNSQLGGLFIDMTLSSSKNRRPMAASKSLPEIGKNDK